MQKHHVSALCGCLLSIALVAQDNGIESVLQRVKQNNQELEAYRAYIESATLASSTTNNLPAPQVSAYYMPFGDHVGGVYTEYEVSQSFEFPTVYVARNALNDRKQEELEARLEQRRQAVLLEAEKLCYEVIYLRQRKSQEETRKQQAVQIFEQVQELFKQEQIGILTLNKAKIAWLQTQFSVTQTEQEMANALLRLEAINGGKPIAFELSSYPESLEVLTFDSLWTVRLQKDPEIKALSAREAVTLQQLKLSKNRSLPDLTAGFNQQGVAGSVYAGFYGGLSIPLWNHRNEVKSAKAQYSFEQASSDVALTRLYTTYRQQFSQYELALEKHNEYKSALGTMATEKLLLEAYSLGEISFMEYYAELSFYREAYDQMMIMEKDLYQQKARLLKHRY